MMQLDTSQSESICRVLLVDDNADATESLAMLLELAGFETATATSGPQALQVGAEQLPTVVLLDIGMPDMDGYETCRRMRATPWGRSIPIFAMTGWSEDADHARSREAGFSAHLVKPVEPAELLDLLKRMPGCESDT